MDFFIERESINKVISNKLDFNRDNFQKLVKSISKFCKGQKDKFFLIFDEERIEIILDGENNVLAKIQEVFDSLYGDDELVEFKIEVLKRETIFDDKKNKLINIYSVDKFMDYFLYNESDEELTFTQRYSRFLRMIEESKKHFLLLNDKGSYVTNSIIISNSIERIKLYSLKDEAFEIDITKKIQSNCNINGIEKLLLPDSFHFLEVEMNGDEINNKVIDIFNKISLTLTSIYLSNFSMIKNNVLTLRIEGYKLISSVYDLKQLNEYDYLDVKTKEKLFFEIYEWIYKSDSSLLERLEIARNLISLYINGESLYDVPSDVLHSIKSNFEIYLKENVDKYLEILNNSVSLLQELNNEASKRAEDLSENLKNNFIAFLTFFVSTILMNTLSTGQIENIFTRDITIITIGMIAVSLLYLAYIIMNFNQGIIRLRENYTRNADYYRVILDPEDIQRIFRGKENSYEETDVKYLKTERNKTICMWVLTLGVIIAVLFFLGTLERTDVYLAMVTNYL